MRRAGLVWPGVRAEEIGQRVGQGLEGLGYLLAYLLPLSGMRTEAEHCLETLSLAQPISTQTGPFLIPGHSTMASVSP